MYSIGDIIDKLIIENIKLSIIREKMDRDGKDVDGYRKMMVLNQNRSEIMKFLDEKIEKVVGGKEKNQILKTVKTYK